MNGTRPDLIVVGGGIAGSAAALRAAQYELDVAWIRGTPKTAKASRGKYVYNVDNMLGVHSDIVMKKVLAELSADELAPARAHLAGKHFHIGTQDLAENALERVQRELGGHVTILDEEATKVEPDPSVDERGFLVATGTGRELRTDSLVLATGVMDRQPSIKKTLKSGRVLDDVRWVYPWANQERLLYCVRCEGHLAKETPVVVIGSSESAAQIAMMLHERYGTSGALLANGEALTATSESLALLERYGVQVRRERIVDLDDEGASAGPKGSELHAVLLEGGERIPARHAVVALGIHRVYNDLARQLAAELEPSAEPEELRHVLVEDATAETSVPGLFAVGDLARRRDGGPSMKQIYTAQEYAVRAVDTIDRRRRLAARRALLEST